MIRPLQPLSRSRCAEARALARRAREACVRYVTHATAFDPGLDAFNPRTLKCFCAIASVFLSEVLNQHGIAARPENHTGHCWVRSGDYLIDITASQFGGPVISIRKAKAAPRSFDLTDWRRGQRPYRYRIRKLHSLFC